MRGTPFLYQGEELGLTDAFVPERRVVDPDGRDGCRAPIPWTADGDDESGHGWPTAPWLPFPTNASTHAADVQHGDPASTLGLYRRLLQLRRDLPVLRHGTFELADLDGTVLRYDRRLDPADGDGTTSHVVVVVNVGDDPVPWPTSVRGDVLVSSTDRTVVGGELAADEAVVVAVR
jgi:alpha-glucosidase